MSGQSSSQEVSLCYKLCCCFFLRNKGTDAGRDRSATATAEFFTNNDGPNKPVPVLTKEELLKKQKEEKMQAMQERKAQYLENFNEEGDDHPALKESELVRLSHWEQFEKSFPFYRMNINGFMKLIKDAMRYTYREKPETQIYEMAHVTLESLREAFSKHTTWSTLLEESDQENPNILMRLLIETCRYEGDDAFAERSYSVKKIRIFAILWCTGGNDEKCVEFYDMLQDNDHPTIAATDKDFKENLFEMFDWAAVNICRHEELVIGSQTPKKVFSEEEIENMKETYNDLAEDFIDKVFEFEAKLPRDQWEELVVEHMSYVFDPKLIREKLNIKE